MPTESRPEIHNWKARRSGAHITLTGTDANGTELTIPRVEQIECDAPFPFARLENGDRIALVTVS